MYSRVYTFPEKTSQAILVDILDENGDPIASASLTTLKLTLYNRITLAIINARDQQNVLNLNGVTVHATNGIATWIMVPADNVLGDDTLSVEDHVALFEWTYVAGAKRGQHEALIAVVNSAKVT